MRDAEQVADRWAHVVDTQFAAGGFGVDVETHKRAEAAAVHVRELLEVEDDVRWTGQ